MDLHEIYVRVQTIRGKKARKRVYENKTYTGSDILKYAHVPSENRYRIEFPILPCLGAEIDITFQSNTTAYSTQTKLVDFYKAKCINFTPPKIEEFKVDIPCQQVRISRVEMWYNKPVVIKPETFPPETLCDKVIHLEEPLEIKRIQKLTIEFLGG